MMFSIYCIALPERNVPSTSLKYHTSILMKNSSFDKMKDLVSTLNRNNYKSGIRQSISGLPAAAKALLIVEKGRLPKKPRLAERGEG